MLVLIVGVFLFATILIFYFWAWGIRGDVTKADPAFAAALYRSGTEQALMRSYPVRGYVLFSRKAPAELRLTLLPLRILYGVNAVLVLALAWSVVHG